MNTSPQQRGFSLIEMLIYVALLSLIFIVVVNTILSFTTSYKTLSAMRKVEDSANTAMERMTRDIRAASSIDNVNSTLGTNPGVLVIMSTQNGISTTTKFYTQSGALKVDVNGVYEGPLTIGSTTVTNLVFTPITGNITTEVKIDLTLQARTGSVTQTKSYHSTIVLKGQ